jgi:hypothetical protein
LAATTVPPGGLITSFLGNQVTNCAIICPLLVQTAVTPLLTTLQVPGTFLTALQTGDLLKAIGAAAASVTGPTNAAAAAAILADGSIPAPRTLNALEVAVVGLLNVIPAAAGGLPGIVAALQTARQDTFDAQHLPVVPNQPSTVMPHGVVPVVVVSALNVVGAVIFPAFNHILSGVFQVPDAVAQELAATGDPVRALAAGINAATTAVAAAGADIATAVAKAASDIRAATGQPVTASRTVQTERSATAKMPTSVERGSSAVATSTSTSTKHDDEPSTSRPAATTAKHDDEPGTSHPAATASTKHDDEPGTSQPATASTKHEPGTSHSSHDDASSHGQSERSADKKDSAKPHHTASK